MSNEGQGKCLRDRLKVFIDEMKPIRTKLDDLGCELGFAASFHIETPYDGVVDSCMNAAHTLAELEREVNVFLSRS